MDGKKRPIRGAVATQAQPKATAHVVGGGGGNEMAAFTSSLENSLEENRALQEDLLDALRSLSGKMAENRRLASRLTRELYLEAEGGTEGERGEKPGGALQQKEFPSTDMEMVRKLLQSMLKGEDESAETTTTTTTGPAEQEEDDNIGNSVKKMLPRVKSQKIKQQWTVDPYCKSFKRQFFVDEMGTTPKPNPDTIKRRRIEQEHSDTHFFPHLSPPWTNQERKLLSDFVQKNKSNSTVNYDAAAKHVNLKRKADNDQQPMRQSRTPKECEIYHQRQIAENQTKLTKTEIQNVLQQVQQQQQQQMQDYNDNNNKEEKDSIDWQAVADAVGNNRTAWQCFVAYQKVQYGAPTQPTWTPQQDELLLKYVAAQGPQFVVDVTSVDEMCCRLFPDKTQRQVFLRINQSLVNPNLQSSQWTLAEERKLVLCQKIYKQAPLHVPVHFPNRSSRSVREKWSRNLDPAFTKTKPFTSEEDALLKRVVQEQLDHVTTTTTAGDESQSKNQCGSAISWADIAREHFPNRRCEHLRARWIQELATEEEMLHKIKADLATQQRIAPGGPGGVGGGTGNSRQQLDDYVVQVVDHKKKKKRKKN